MDFLDNLRAKPVHVRKRIAFVTTTVLSLMIASVCWGSWNNNGATAPAAQIAERPTISPWRVAWNTAVRAKNETVAAFHGVTGQLAEVVEKGLESAPFGGDEQTASVESAVEDSIVPDDTAPEGADVSMETTSSDETGEVIHTRPKLMKNNEQ